MSYLTFLLLLSLLIMVRFRGSGAEPTTIAKILNADNFHSTIYNRSNYVFVYFYSAKCKTCEDYSKVFDDLAKHLNKRHNIIISKVNIDEVEIGDNLKIQETSFKLFKSGDNQVVNFKGWIKTVETFSNFLEKNCRVGLSQSNSVRDRNMKYNLQDTNKFTRDELWSASFLLNGGGRYSRLCFWIHKLLWLYYIVLIL